MHQLICVIPARYASSRFPGKPLASIAGRPMIEWVYEHANKAKHVHAVVLATDDGRIVEAARNVGCEAMLTSPECPNGSARVAEVAHGLPGQWVFEMQGDQPLVTPDVIDDFIERAFALVEKNPAIDVVIPYAVATDEQTDSPDILKVVKTASDRLVFQTRQPVKTGWRTLGLYLWKRQSLLRFAELPVSDIERAEDSHPIRLYVNDFYVQGLPIEDTQWVEVDRPHQVVEVEDIMRKRGII